MSTAHTHEHDHPRHYKNIKIKSLSGSLVEITGEISAKALEEARVSTLQRFSSEINMPGFRKGHVPEHVIISKIGENGILEEAAEMVLSHEYVHIIIDKNIQAIGRPEVTFTKLERNAPLEFKIVVTVFPEVTMPDYKKIAKKVMAEKEKIEVTDKDMEEALEKIKAHYKKETRSEAEISLNDEFVQKLGDFTTVDDFKKKLKEDLLKEKEYRAKEKKRLKVSDEIVAGMKLEMPEILVTGEIKKMWNEFEHDISRFGLKLEDYLKHIKKDRPTLEKEWRKDAEKRVSLQIGINKIAGSEKLVPKEDAIEKEVALIMNEMKDVDMERARNYVEMVLTNEQVYRFLEEQA